MAEVEPQMRCMMLAADLESITTTLKPKNSVLPFVCPICATESSCTDDGKPCMPCRMRANSDAFNSSGFAPDIAPAPDENRLKKRGTTANTSINDGKPFGIKPWSNACSVVPSSIARSSVFGIKTRDFKGFHSQSTTKINCARQLSHEHLMVWLACLNEVKTQHNYTFFAAAAAIIRGARLNIKHARFNQIMSDLAGFELEVITAIRGEYKTFKGKLIKGFERGGEGGLKIALDPNLEQIFARDFTVIDLDQIAAIKSRIGRALYPYIRSHRATGDGLWATYDTYRALVGSKSADGRDLFHRQLIAALDELQKLEIIAHFERKFRANQTGIKLSKSFDMTPIDEAKNEALSS